MRLLLLISVDTLRVDRLGVYGGPTGLTPELDALAARSVVFDAAYAPVAHTLPSVAALLTGRYPQELGVFGNRARLPDDAETLATRFRAAGWRTAAVVSNWVLRAETGTDRGFQHFDDRMTRLEAARAMPERTGPETTRAALDALAACLPDDRAPCLLWVHYQDPHGPYTPPESLRAARLAVERERPDADRRLPLLPGPFGRGGIPDYQVVDGRDDVAFYRAGYDAEVAYLDGAIGRLLGAVADEIAPESTAIVFAADHGEALGEQDFWFGHGERLGEEQVRVPLWFALPGVASARRADVASLLDVMPTLEDALLGGAEPSRAGRALLAPGATRGASVVLLATLRGSKQPRIGVVEGDYKYVASLREDRAWDGRLTRRGDDTTDLTAPAPHVALRLRSSLDALRRRHPPAPELELELDADDRARLRALGYLEPEKGEHDAR